MPVSYFIHKEEAMKLDLKKNKMENKLKKLIFGGFF